MHSISLLQFDFTAVCSCSLINRNQRMVAEIYWQKRVITIFDIPHVILKVTVSPKISRLNGVPFANKWDVIIIGN